MHYAEDLPEDDVQTIPSSSAIDVNFPKDLFELHRLSTAFLNKGDFRCEYKGLLNRHVKHQEYLELEFSTQISLQSDIDFKSMTQLFSVGLSRTL